MKGELLKRLFRAIAGEDRDAIDKLTYLVIEDERKKGHTLLASQLENIAQKSAKSNRERWSTSSPSDSWRRTEGLDVNGSSLSPSFLNDKNSDTVDSGTR